MRSWIAIGLAIVAAVCAFRSAYLWVASTNTLPEPKGFEPVIPQLRQNWWQLAEWEAATRSGQFNRSAAIWAGAAAAFGLASAIISLWQN